MAATLLTAQDANWNIERGAFNILVDQQPAGIAVPRSADDASAAGSVSTIANTALRVTG
jgi:hypothetical protein